MDSMQSMDHHINSKIQFIIKDELVLNREAAQHSVGKYSWEGDGKLYLCWQSLPRPPEFLWQSTHIRMSGASDPGFAVEVTRKENILHKYMHKEGLLLHLHKFKL